MIRINKERNTELGILAQKYGKSKTQILNDLVQEAFQNLLGEYAHHDSAV
jgi:hypothetical protein